MIHHLRFMTGSVPRFGVRSEDRSINTPLQRSIIHHPSSIIHPRSSSAFSLIEILVTVGILSFMIIGLLALFNQTQKAFRTGMTQSDVLEAGRSTFEMTARELEQMTPSRIYSSTNFLAEVAPPTRLDGAFVPAVFTMALPPDNSGQYRTNVFQHFFFLTRENLQWTGIGYLVDTPTNGFGTLYRFQAQTTNSLIPDQVRTLSSNFNFAAWTLYRQAGADTNLPFLTRIADGVVHMRVRPFSPTGFPLTATNFVLNASLRTNTLPIGIQATEIDSFFYSNAVPAYVELEVGFLEDRTLARLRSIPNINGAQLQYLTNRSAQVHLFRQRIAIRNADPSAYPYP
jgi:hypothetical protein